MIKELSELGKTRRGAKTDTEWVHDALKEEFISLVLMILPDGSFSSLQSIEKKKTMAEAIQRTSGKEARLLIDNCGYVLGVYDPENNAFKNKAKLKGEKAAHEYFQKEFSEKKQLFISKLEKIADLVDTEPVLKFYGANSNKGINAVTQEYFVNNVDKKDRSGNIAFLVSGRNQYVHECDSVYHRIIETYEAKEQGLLSGSKKKCAVCGKCDYPVEDIPHGMVKRVPEGQSSGCALVSYNTEAFESYGLRRNLNSMVCTNCARTYVEGLNWLLSNGNDIPEISEKGKAKQRFKYTNRKNFGNTDTAMIYWTRKNIALPEIDFLETPSEGDVTGLIESVSSGKETASHYLEPDQFYSCTLSGAASRIAVRDWIEVSLADYKKAIAQWFKDIAIEEHDFVLKRTLRKYFGLYNLASSCQRQNTNGGKDKNDTSTARVAAILWNAALKNSALPIWVLANVLKRARLSNEGVTAERAALIKIILNRNNKGGDFVITETLQEGKRPVAYVCGQIFAAMESMQYAAASGERNAGIRERYFTYAMTLPLAAFGRLFNLNSKHYTKLKNEKPGMAVNLDKELQLLCKDLDINQLPATFSLEQQGQFAIGYYQQRQKQFNNKSEEK